MLLALKNIKGEVVDRPKALGDIRGVTYIYGMFYRFGLIDVPDEVKEKMPPCGIFCCFLPEGKVAGEKQQFFCKAYLTRNNYSYILRTTVCELLFL